MDYEIRHYTDKDGRDHFQQWLESMRDPQAKVRVLQRIGRLTLGNFGDHKPCRESVWELRIDWGPGYRVYYAQVGKTVILLLAGGDKRKQGPDIERAVTYLANYRRRQHEEN